jgi:hypothetical protein
MNIGTNSGRTQYQYITFGGITGGTDYGWQVGRSPNTGGVVNDGFYIYDIKTNNTPFAIALGGNVGIGTTSVGAKLQVNNAATVGTGASAMSAINPIIFVDNGSTANGSIVIKAHSVGAGNVVGALRFASSPDGVNYNYAGIEALSAASATVETLVFKISPSNSSAATSTEIMRINSNGLLIGTQTSIADTKLIIGGSYGRGAYLNGIIPSTVTSTARYVNTVAQTTASVFTLTNLQHYFAEQTTFGTGSTVTNQFGFYVENNLIGATNNYGFYGNIASGANRWNLYMAGTANNFLAGNLGIGTTTTTSGTLQVNGNVFATSFTGSFSGSFAGSIANATSASYATFAASSSYALSASYAPGSGASVSASYATFAASSSYALSASYALNASTATTASFATSAANATTASYVQNAASASYAFTSSYAATSSFSRDFTVGSSLVIDQTLTDYTSVAASSVGSNNLFTQNTGSYTSAFFKYTCYSASFAARAGEVIAVWNGTSVQFTDFSTVDFGNTTPVTASVSIVTGQVQLNIQTNTSGWTIKSMATFI